MKHQILLFLLFLSFFSSCSKYETYDDDELREELDSLRNDSQKEIDSLTLLVEKNDEERKKQDSLNVLPKYYFHDRLGQRLDTLTMDIFFNRDTSKMCYSFYFAIDIDPIALLYDDSVTLEMSNLPDGRSYPTGIEIFYKKRVSLKEKIIVDYKKCFIYQPYPEKENPFYDKPKELLEKHYHNVGFPDDGIFRGAWVTFSIENEQISNLILLDKGYYPILNRGFHRSWEGGIYPQGNRIKDEDNYSVIGIRPHSIKFTP